MEILGRTIYCSPEDRKVIAGYLKPFVKQFAIGQAKKVGAIAGKKAGICALCKIDDALTCTTRHKKLKFVTSKARAVAVKPKKDKKRVD